MTAIAARWNASTFERETMRLLGSLIAVAQLAITAFGCGVVAESGAEAEMVIGSEVSCTSCSIAVDTMLTLEDATLGGPTTSIARDSAGLLYIVDYFDNFILRVYGNDGRFIRQIGRPGGGPGEYETITNVLIGRDGMIHVLDEQLARHSKFTRYGEFIEAVMVPRLALGIGAAVLLPDDRIVISSGHNRIDPERALLRVIDHQGNAPAYGEAFRSEDPRPWLQSRLLWARASGGLLVAEPYSFVMQVLDANSRETFRVRRVADWVPADVPDELPGDGVLDKPYTPRLRAIWEDSEGLLWLTMAVPSGSWRPARPVESLQSSMGSENMNDELAKLATRPRLETIIEAVDLERGNVLARLRLPGPQGLPFGGGYFAKSVEEDSIGEPKVRITRVQLKR